MVPHAKKEREIWFERIYSPHHYQWRPVQRDGWRAIAVMAGGLSVLLLAAIAAPLLGADPIWTLAIMIGCLVLAAWFAWTIRGRVR